MDKCKLIRIIEKELEELKVITGEVSENEKDSELILEIALGKARVLCSEIELLRALSAKEKVHQEITQEDAEDADEASDVTISDPELEIAEPGNEDENMTYSPDEFDEADALTDDLEEDELSDEDNDWEDDDDLEDDDIEDGEDPKEDLIEFEQDKQPDDEEEVIPEQPIEKNENKIDSKPGFREINIEDGEDESISFKTQPISKTTERPIIREIPKPEEPDFEETEVTEPVLKGSTINDTIGETKTSETKINTGSIHSLKAAIGLNDRYLFVREIFANNTEKYNKVIDHLDKLETIQQAVEYLKSQLTLQKTETSMKFVELLKRRFTK